MSIKLKQIFVFGCLSNKGLLLLCVYQIEKDFCFLFEFSNHSDMNSSLFDIQRLYFFKCVIWHPLLHSSPNCYLSHLIMNSVTHDILWLEFFLMCHLIPSTTFKPCNHEFSHVWYPMTGVFFKWVIWYSTTLKVQTFYLNHLIVNPVMSDFLWLEFFFKCHLIPSITLKP